MFSYPTHYDAASIMTLSMMSAYASQYNDTFPDKNQLDDNQHDHNQDYDT